MSEQNQMAINPVVAGSVGAIAGGLGGYFIKPFQPIDKEYNNVEKLLTMSNDEFKSIAEAAKDAEKDSEEAKAFKKLEDGRKTVSAAGDELIKEQTTARNEMNTAIETDLEKNLSGDAKTKFAEAVKTEKADFGTAKKAVSDVETALKGARADATSELAKKEAEFRKAYQDEVKAITDKKDSSLGKELADLEASKAGKSGDDLAKIEKDIKAKKAEIGREAMKKDSVKNAQTAMREEKAKIIKPEDLKTKATTLADKKKAYNEKLVSSADEALKDVTAKKDGTVLEKLKALIEEKKAVLAKKAEDVKAEKAKKLVGEGGDLKDFDVKSIKKFLPRAKMWPAIIGAAALGTFGVALAYIVGPKNETQNDVA